MFKLWQYGVRDKRLDSGQFRIFNHGNIVSVAENHIQDEVVAITNYNK
jgi:hypothetical protein